MFYLILWLCLISFSRSSNIGIILDVWSCNSSSTLQLWEIVNGTSGDGFFSLSLTSSPGLLIGGNTNASLGPPLTLVNGSISPPSVTTFSLTPSGELRHNSSGRCVSISIGSIPVIQPGTLLQLSGCVGSTAAVPPNQVWSIASGLVTSALSNTTTPAAAAPLCLDAHSVITCADLDWSTHLYCDPAQPESARVADFVQRLSISDAVPLMARTNGVPRLGLPALFYYEALHGIMSTACLPSPAQNSMGCATSFPAPIGLGAAFNRSLWGSVGSAISTEGRALYNLIGSPSTATLAYYAPNLNPFMSPLWGRGQEVPSEDPYVVSE